MSKKAIFAAVFIGALAVLGLGAAMNLAPAAVSAASNKVDADEFLFINNSDKGIVGIYVSKSGADKWSKNLLDSDERPLMKGKSTDLDRPNFRGSCDFKIVYKDAKEKIWRDVPLRDITHITHNSIGECEYRRPKSENA